MDVKETKVDAARDLYMWELAEAVLDAFSTYGIDFKDPEISLTSYGDMPGVQIKVKTDDLDLKPGDDDVFYDFIDDITIDFIKNTPPKEFDDMAVEMVDDCLISVKAFRDGLRDSTWKSVDEIIFKIMLNGYPTL